MNNNDTIVPQPSFFTRVLSNDSFKKGVGTAIAGVLVATAIELIWPSHSTS